MDPVRLGVVGLGRMGRHHVRCASLAAGVELVGAHDVDAARASSTDARFFSELDALLADCEALVLAVPTDRHGEVARRALDAGCHLLVEKPLAAGVAECAAMRDAARSAGRVLAVGHVERWNGAWRPVSERLVEPRFVEGHRLAAFDPRGTEVDVVMDLMIHDLDLLLAMFGAEPTRVEAVGVAVLTDRVDIASARLEFPGGGLANLTASRVSREPVRKLRIFQQDAYFSLDLATGSAEIFARDASSPFGVTRQNTEPPAGHNPLVRELEEFAKAVRGRPNESIDPDDATRAVALAERVLGSIAERRSIWAAPSY
ncbi:MAG: Gfo/Idh/MocA family oxidoreductase [Gemmatimonadetes bacterium]|nr:Gfo/Idh/MocA family oxidoreductase [Gemmatimonadota bacterium]